MGGSTGNYSGGSSAAYPPSLYDTSVSSASGGRPSRQNTPAHSSVGRQQQEYSRMPNSYANHHQQQRGRHVSPKSSRSMNTNYSDYPHRRDYASMSDPGGGSRLEHTQDQYHHAQSEYARSEIVSPSSSYYESQERFRNPARRFQHSSSWQHQSAKSQSPSSPPRRGLPPHPYHPHQYSSHSARRERSFDETYPSSPSHHESHHERSSVDTSQSSSVRDLKKQLWDQDEVLQVRIPPSPQRINRTKQPMPGSPVRESGRRSLHQQSHQRGPSSASNEVSRFARSLSPRRYQHHQSSHTANNNASPQIHMAGSNISDTSYNNRFHSKFYEAAMVAQHRGEEQAESPLPSNKYPQHRRHRSASSRPFDEDGPDQHAHEYQKRRNHSAQASPPLPGASNRNISPGNAGDYYKNGGHGFTRKESKHDNNARRPPRMTPSPPPPSSPIRRSHERDDRRASRGRSRDASQPKSNDRKSIRRVRTPSPLILERMRSFDNEYHSDHNRESGIPSGRDRGHKNYGADRNNDYPAKDFRNPMDRNERRHDGHQNAIAGRYRGSSNIADKEILRNQPGAGRATSSFRKDSGNDRSKDRNVVAIDRDQMPGGSRPRQQHSPRETVRDDAGGVEDDIGGVEDDIRVAHLVDKLSAISRENPESALAQIDSILRQESRSFHARTVDNTRGVGRAGDSSQRRAQKLAKDPLSKRRQDDDAIGDRDAIYNNDDDDNDEDDDESSDVSSLTNPTFQPNSSRPVYPTMLDSAYATETEHYKLHSTAPSNNPGSRNTGINHTNTSPFTPSTSSFRRPRPSHLHNYSNQPTPSPPEKPISRSELKRQQLQKYPPPSTIKVKDDVLNTEIARTASTDMRERMLERNQSSRTKKETKSYGEQEGKAMEEGPKNKLGTFMTEKQALAQKLRGWDELSNQVSESRSEQERNAQGRKTAGRGTEASSEFQKNTSRRHPWDNKMDLIQTKDTSNEGEVGIELEMDDTEDHYARDTPGTSRNRSDDDIQNRHFEDARNSIRSRNHKNPFDDHGSDRTENDADVSAHFPDISFSVEGSNSNTMPKVNSSLEGVPQFHPNNEDLSRNEGKKRHGKGSGEMDNSWVANPSSSIIPNVDDRLKPASNEKPRAKVRSPGRQPSTPKDPSDLSEHSALETGHGGIEWSLDDANHLTSRNLLGTAESRSIGMLACKTIGNKELQRKEKKPGFLRAFMDKKKKKATGTGSAASAAVGSVGGLSASVESRGVRSASQIHSPRNATNIRLLPAPYGVFESKNDSAKQRGRTGNRSGSAPRHRSGSSEKFRSSSMAKKFNRVMQLYDTEEM